MSAEVAARLLGVISIHSLGGRAATVQTLSIASHILSLRSVIRVFCRTVRDLSVVRRYIISLHCSEIFISGHFSGTGIAIGPM